MKGEPKFKKGDWCFSDFQLVQIKETKENRITSVTDGSLERSGSDLTYSCYPLEMKIKRLSDSVHYWYKRLHELKGVNLNYPDIVRSLEERWVEMCENKDDDKKIKELYEKLNAFCTAIIQKNNDLRYESVEGIPLIRR